MFDKSWSETVEPCGHRGVGGEEIAGSGYGQSDFEGLASLLHEIPRAF